MPIVDPHVVNQLLLATECEMQSLGWGHPDVLFAITGSLGLEYVMQLPDQAGEFLQQLLQAGMQARAGILGLVLVTTVRRRRPIHSRAVIAVLRDGCMAAIAREGAEPVHLVERIPRGIADHDELAGLAMKLLAG